MLKTAVALLLAAAAFALSPVALAQESPPEAPQGVQLRMRDGGPLINWLRVTGAETYEVRKAYCESGSPSNCTIASTTETGWQGAPADMPEGGYLVAACNDDSGCGEEVQPVLVDDRPEAPGTGQCRAGAGWYSGELDPGGRRRRLPGHLRRPVEPDVSFGMAGAGAAPVQGGGQNRRYPLFAPRRRPIASQVLLGRRL